MTFGRWFKGVEFSVFFLNVFVNWSVLQLGATATDAVRVFFAESLATKADVGPLGSKSSVGIGSWVTSGASSRVSLVTMRMLRGKRWSSMKVKVEEVLIPCVAQTFVSQKGRNTAQRQVQNGTRTGC